MLVSTTTKKLLRAVGELDGDGLFGFMVKTCRFDPDALERTLEQYEGAPDTPRARQSLAIRLGAFADKLRDGEPVLRRPAAGPMEEDARALIVCLDPMEYLILSGEQAGYAASHNGRPPGLWKLLSRLRGASRDDIPGFTVLARVRWEGAAPSVAYFSAGAKERAENSRVVNYRSRKVSRKIDLCPEWAGTGSCRGCGRGLLAPDRRVRTLRHTCEYAMRKEYDGA